MIMAATYVVYASAGLLLLALTGSLRMPLDRALVYCAWFLIALALAAALSTQGIYFDSTYAFDDLWVPMDAVARVIAGQASSLDFESPIGPLFFLVLELTERLFGFDLALIVKSNILVAIVSLLLTGALLYRRITPLGFATACLIVVATALSTRELMDPFARATSSALAPYNRWGWALLTPVALRLCAPLPDRASRWDDAGSVATGVAIAMLALLKISYGAVAFALLISTAVVRPGGLRDSLIAGAAAVLCLIGFEAITGQFSANLRDIATISEVSGGGRRFLKIIRIFGEASYYSIISLILFAIFAPYATLAPSVGFALIFRWISLYWRPASLIFISAAGGLVALFQNHYHSEATLYFASVIISYEWIKFINKKDAIEKEANWGPISAIFFLIATIWPTVDVGTAVAQAAGTRIFPRIPEFAHTRIAGLVVDPQLLPPEDTPDRWRSCATGTCADVAEVIDGYHLLKDVVREGDTVLTFAFSNPFTTLLDIDPPPAPIWFHENRSFSRLIHPPVDILFDGVEYIFILKTNPEGKALRSIYGDFIDKEFVEFRETEFWILYARQ